MNIKSLIAFTFLFSICFSVKANTLRIDTSEGYPYKNLIQKADKVTIKYSELKERIDCQVTIEANNQTFEGIKYKVSQKRFKKAPMAACMDREFAKQLVKQL